MNARRLTLLLLIFSAALANWLVKPETAKAGQARRTLLETQAQYAAVLKREADVKQLPQGRLELPESDAAVTGSLARWMRNRRDYGVAFNDVQSVTSRGGQTEMPVSALQAEHAPTGLKVQTLNIKGQYESIEAFQRFLRDQMVGHGASLSAVKLQNNSFTLDVQVFGR